MLEDDAHDVARVTDHLRKGGFSVQINNVANQTEFIHHLAHEAPDIILSDNEVPGFNGFEALAVAREKHPEIPFVFVANLAGNENEIETLQNGGIDYVLKNRLVHLVPVVQRNLREAAKQKEHRKLEQALIRQEEYFRALVDSVTDYAICHLDGEGRINTWNTGAEWVNGFGADEMIGQHFSCFYPADAVGAGQPQHALAQAYAQGRFQDEVILLRKGSIPYWANLVITPLPQTPDDPRGFALVIRDITSRKQTEVERERIIQEFQNTLNNVKILSGLVPICAACKKVRDYKGHWHPLESYLREHSEATLTHEFCADCAKHIQPEHSAT